MSPDGIGRSFFIVEAGRLLGHFRDTGNYAKAMEGLLLPEVVDSPAGTWIDLKREGQKEGICYCGKPHGIHRDPTIELPIPPKKVFAVFIAPQRAKGGQLRITKWGWVEESPERAGFPIDHAERFGRRTWPLD